MSAGLNTSDGDNVPPEYSVQEIGQMVFDLTVRVANDEKKIQSNRFAQESFERKQTALNLTIEDHLARLLTTVEGLARKPPDPVQTPTSATTARGWALPRSITVKPVGFDAETWPKLKFDPPRFDGEGVNMWIKKIQKYYNHNFTPLADRLYLTEFLLDDAAVEWFGFWESNNEGRCWDDFLMDIKRRFDPDLYEDYVGRLASLRQTGSLDNYLAAFEPILQKVSHVGDSTLTSLFIAGLTTPLKHELLTRPPASLSDAISLAKQLSVCHVAAATPSSLRSSAPLNRVSRRRVVLCVTIRSSEYQPRNAPRGHDVGCAGIALKNTHVSMSVLKSFMLSLGRTVMKMKPFMGETQILRTTRRIW